MLLDNLNIVLGNSFVLYAKASGFHWNVEGSNFIQLHELFGDVYAAAYDTIDRTAEFIRVIDHYAPQSLSKMIKYSTIVEQDRMIKADVMIKELKNDCRTFIDSLNEAFSEATSDGEEGIANFLAERIDAFGKLEWKLRSTLR